jgi:uncharacterized membrane protein YfcA
LQKSVADLVREMNFVSGSGIIYGYVGFGGALLMVPLFTLLLGPIEAIAIASVIGIFGSAQLYPGAARHARWRELLPISIAIGIVRVNQLEADRDDT